MRIAKGSVEAKAHGEAAFERLVRRVQACVCCQEMQHVHVLGQQNGPVPAPIMFIGEAVGRLGGARTGVPMTSDATGRRFNALLAEAGIARAGVFITNAVLCNPLRNGCNRRPRRSEVAACSPFLAEQVRLVDPAIIVTLGDVPLAALRLIAPHNYRLRDHVGQVLLWGQRLLVPLYHTGPRALLHRPADKQTADWRQLGLLALQLFPYLRHPAGL